MKNSNFYPLAIAALTLLFVACGNQNKKNTSATNDKDEIFKEGEHKLIFENDYAKVAKVRLAPGESIQPHDGEQRMIYSLTDYDIDWEEQGKNLGVKTWKKGYIHFHEAGQHSAKNTGETAAEWIVFSRKIKELPDCKENTLDNNLSSVSAQFANVLFDNDAFKVTEVTLPVHEVIPMHLGINRIIYSLSDYTLKYKSDTNEEVEKQFKRADTHWHEGCKHELQNIGDTDAKFLIVSYKR